MKAVTVGSAVIDVITIVAPENIERMSLENNGKSYLLLEQGRKVPAQSITNHVGGGGCNAAVALARLGFSAAVRAKVGADLNGLKVHDHLDEQGVSHELLISTPDHATGVSVMVASHDRNATIFVHRGANEMLTCEEVPGEIFDGAALMHISGLSSGSADCFPLIVERASSAGAFVSSNPGIRQITSRGAALLDALRHVDLLSINRVEAEAITPALFARAGDVIDSPPPPGAPRLMHDGLCFGGFEIGLHGFMDAVRACGPSWVLVTDGSGGAYLGGEGGVWWQPIVPTTVAGSAGAGDAFCSTLAGSLARGTAPDEALARAAVNAAAVVAVVDTTSGLLDEATLAARAAEAMRNAPGRLFPAP